MARNRPADSSGGARPAAGQKIDTPVLVVSMLTAFFATVFATLLLLRPESGDSTESKPARLQTPTSGALADTPPVDAPPPVPGAEPQPPRAEPQLPKAGTQLPRTEPQPPRTEPPAALRAELEALGIRCAEGADCYPE